MVPRETVSFVFPRVLMFPETKSRETSGSRDHTEGPYIKCFVIYLDFHIAKTKTNKDGVRATTAQLYPGQDTFEFDQRHVTKNQPITVE